MTDPQPDDLTEASRRLDLALDIEPTNIVALWDKCFLRRLQRRIDEALPICQRVLDLNPHHPGAMREIGHDLMMLGDLRGAIGWFQAAIDAAPQHQFVSDAYFGIAACEYMLGHTERAIATARESLEHDTGGNLAGLWLATVLETEGRHGEAETALAEFYRRHPEFPPSSTVPARIIRTLSPKAEAEQTLAAMRQLGVPDAQILDGGTATAH